MTLGSEYSREAAETILTTTSLFIICLVFSLPLHLFLLLSFGAKYVTVFLLLFCTHGVCIMNGPEGPGHFWLACFVSDLDLSLPVQWR